MRWRVTTKDRECAIDVTREAVGIGMCSQLFSGSGWEIEARPSEEDSQQTVVVEIYRSAPPQRCVRSAVGEVESFLSSE